jgi:hypothetical protein
MIHDVELAQRILNVVSIALMRTSFSLLAMCKFTGGYQ